MAMVQAATLILIGYWNGPQAHGSWPDVTDFVDENWDMDERELVANYLGRGQVFRAYMGYSMCRICGEKNGVLELTDGTYAWPEGLAHYVSDHGVRLPDRFVRHVSAVEDALESAAVNSTWWANLGEAREA